MFNKNDLKAIYNCRGRYIQIANLSLVKPDKNQHEWLAIGAKIGEGSFGFVYRTDYKIVFKTIDDIAIESVNYVIKMAMTSKKCGSVDKQLQAASKEAMYLRRHGIEAKSPFLEKEVMITVMENCGRPLVNFLNGNKANLEQRLEYALSIINEVFILQKKGTIHCDIKPENICVKQLDSKNQSTNHPLLQFLLIDFGLSCSTHDQHRKQPGSRGYMPPEAAEGMRTVSSDLYALAAVLAQVFGCSFQSLFFEKLKTEDFTKHCNAPYRFCELLSGFDKSDFDKGFKNDLVSLLKELSDPNPNCRPSVEVLMKFFIHSRWHRKECQEQIKVQSKLRQARDQAQALNQSIDELNECITRLIKKLSAQNMGTGTLQINREEHVPVPFPSYYCAIKEYIKSRSKIEQFIEEIEPMIPDFNKEQQRIQNKQKDLLAFEKFWKTLDTLLTDSSCKNSSGLKELRVILSEKKRTLFAKWTSIQQLALRKSKGLPAWYSRSSLFGRGRNPKVDAFYKETAGLIL